MRFNTLKKRDILMQLEQYFFVILSLIGGLCLFLFGMDIMGKALERCAGNRLHDILGKLTTKKMLGFLTGLGVTAIIQSSSATTVMVVGFVNSGLMNLAQAINVIIGANVGTTVTAWILSLSGIEGENFFIQLLKPSSFTPILALIGIGLNMFSKSSRKKDIGVILLGFATLMFGMEGMSDAVSSIKNEPWFAEMFTAFRNPLLAMLAGAILTAIIQSSSASVGILQALSLTGVISYEMAIPIVMGQGIGTCITAMLSAIGATKNAKRAAVAHLSFNVIGTAVFLTIFWIFKGMFADVLSLTVSPLAVALIHTGFKLLCTLLLLPSSKLLEKLSCLIVRDAKQPETVNELDDRLLETPSIALERCRDLTLNMAEVSIRGLKGGLKSLFEFSAPLADEIRECEDKGDYYEDILGTYLVKLSSRPLGDHESGEAAMILRLIGDFERISDHGVGVLESAEELKQKSMSLSDPAYAELRVMANAVNEIMDLSLRAFRDNDLEAAAHVEPLEQVIDGLKDQLRARHIERLQQGACTIEAGFIWSDILTDLERAADHCSNIAASVIDVAQHNMNLHESLRAVRSGSDSEFEQQFRAYSERFSLAK